MPAQARLSTPGPGLTAAGAFLVAQMLIGGYGFFAPLSLALVLAIAIAAFFLAQRGDAKSVREDSSWTPPPASGPSQVKQVREPAAAPVTHEPTRAAPKAGPGREAGGEPAGLEVPRDSGPDDLKPITGIGLKLQAESNGRGIFDLDQVASWSGAEVALWTRTWWNSAAASAETTGFARPGSLPRVARRPGRAGPTTAGFTTDGCVR